MQRSKFDSAFFILKINHVEYYFSHTFRKKVPMFYQTFKVFVIAQFLQNLRLLIPSSSVCYKNHIIVIVIVFVLRKVVLTPLLDIIKRFLRNVFKNCSVTSVVINPAHKVDSLENWNGKVEIIWKITFHFLISVPHCYRV
jgi:hypothetical protein